MKRINTNVRHDAQLFKRTARSVAKANLASTSFRGGIRL